MPAVSLVVCLHNEREELQRLLQRSAGCYDDLVVVHDGPDINNTQEVVEHAGGRFFEGTREWQQEPHWPFAWGKAKHDWILRLDADEFPSAELKKWLQQFRQSPEPDKSVSGFTCIWPLWNGQRAVSKKWPAGRNFLFHRQRIRFFGLVEQVPVPDGKYESLELVLEHQPKRKSYGLINILARKRVREWRVCIARSLLGKPTDLVCWRWESTDWPVGWEEVRRCPLRTGFSRLVMGTFRGLREQWRCEGRIFPTAAIIGPLHHALFCFKYWRLRRRQRTDN
jgi:Glycosyl transferase family 2.